MMRHLWPLLIGFTIWAVAFLAVYALQALGCAWNWQPAWHRIMLISATAVTLATLAATLAVQLRRAKDEPSTIERGGTILTAAALPTTLVLFAPVAFLSLCT